MTSNSQVRDTIARAEALLRKRAAAATPGPWERPLDTRHKDFAMAALPSDEEPRTWEGGIIPAHFSTHKGPTGRYAGQRERVGAVDANIDSIGKFTRKRAGADLEYIALMDPDAGEAVADLLSYVITVIDTRTVAATYSTKLVLRAYMLACRLLGEPPDSAASQLVAE